MQHNIVGNMILLSGNYEEENELQLFDNPNVTNPCIEMTIRIIILLAYSDDLLMNYSPAKFYHLPNISLNPWDFDEWFWGVLCCFARHNYHSLGHFSWTLSFLLMLHMITRSLQGVLPLIVMAGTSIALFIGYSVWNVLQLFQGPHWPPSHQSSIIFHGRARRSLSFLLCCNMTSWNLKDKTLGCNVFPSLIKHLSVLTNNHFPRTCL